MRLQSHQTLAAIVALGSALLFTGFSRAEVFTSPNGQWIRTVTGPSNAVWDVSSISDLANLNVSVTNDDTSVEATGPVAPLVQNGIGKFSSVGTNTTTLTINDNDGFSEQTFIGTYSLKGNITGGKGHAHGTLIQTVAGTANIEGMRKVRASSTIKFTIDSVAGTVSVVERSLASAAGKGTISNQDTGGPDPVTEVFGGDGSWTLTMDLSTTGKAISGTATITLNSGRVFEYSVKGTFNPNTLQSRINLKGTGNAKGSTLQVWMDAEVVTLIKGRITGQSVNVANP